MAQLSADSHPSELNLIYLNHSQTSSSVLCSPMLLRLWNEAISFWVGGRHRPMSNVIQCCFDHETNQNIIQELGRIYRQATCNQPWSNLIPDRQLATPIHLVKKKELKFILYSLRSFFLLFQKNVPIWLNTVKEWRQHSGQIGMNTLHMDTQKLQKNKLLLKGIHLLYKNVHITVNESFIN